ncbi:MAG: outer membrane beta-barrel protein [Terriglobales bacterium]|jgi:opacity protein-like surface antigen
MKWSCLIVITLALLGAALPVAAQDQASKFELYGGYYYTRVNVNASAVGGGPSETFNGNGGGGQFEYNATNHIGLVADLAGFGATSTENGALVGGAFTYLFGPRVNCRLRRITPFGQALFGGIRTTNGIGESASENNFALTAGGGIDFKVSRQVSVRPVQAEYFMSKIPDGLNDRQNNLRLGAGVVFRLGRD